MIHRLKSKMKVVIDKLITLFEGKNIMTNQSFICFNKFLSEKLFDFSVFSLFSIDFSFLMSFVGAVISFSILFFEMEDKTQ